MSLLHDDFYEALRACVMASGGYKTIGPLMRPEMTPPKAAEWLACCFNPDRPEKLSPEQVLLILREARRNDCHAGIDYIARDCGYEYKPVTPEDEMTQLMQRYVQAAEGMEKLTSAILRVQERCDQGGRKK